ncbi:MAG: hypothetical protein COA42_15820 [Alteromonadaceae bacterium]|nr:MAG: hypothetical protein COA42_15820 [Alteromonadaceae bacterium]
MKKLNNKNHQTTLSTKLTCLSISLILSITACTKPSEESPQNNKQQNKQTVYRNDFNKDALGAHFASTWSKVSAACGPDKSQCLKTEYEPSSVGSARQVRKYPIPPATEYTLQFDVKFDDNFDFKRGGKMHGLGPEHRTTGCKEQSPNGWSARIMWRKEGIAELYIYDQTRKANKQICGWSYRTTSPAFILGKYQALSLYVKLNQIGHNNGTAELWIDGALAIHKDQIIYRENDKESDISQFLFSTFFGGNAPSWAPKETVFAYYDNFAVHKGKKIRQSSNN